MSGDATERPHSCLPDCCPSPKGRWGVTVTRMAPPQRGPGGLPVHLSDMTSPALEMDSFLHDSFATRVVQRAQARTPPHRLSFTWRVWLRGRRSLRPCSPDSPRDSDSVGCMPRCGAQVGQSATVACGYTAIDSHAGGRRALS